MRLSRRGQVNAWVAIVAAAVLFAWMRIAVTPQVPAPAVAREISVARGTPAAPQIGDERAAASDEPAEHRKAQVASVRGRVFDTKTQAPIKAFEIQFFRWNPYRAAGPIAFQSADGRFEWRDLAPDEWMIAATAPGYQRLEFPVVVPAGTLPRELLLPLRRGQALEGRVYDKATSAGIADARLTFREENAVYYGDNWRSRRGFTTSSDGSFRLDGVPFGRVTLDVYAKDYASRHIDLTVADTNPTLDIALSDGAAISGRLTAADAVTPVAGTIGLMNLDKHEGSSGKTGPAGEFSYRGLEPGRYRLSGSGDGGTAQREIEVGDAERIQDLVLALQAGGTVRGTIGGVRAQDMARVKVLIEQLDTPAAVPLAATPDERGNYSVRGVPIGRVQVAASVPSRRLQMRRTEMPTLGDITVDFDFPRGARLSGRVTRQGKPLAEVMIGPGRPFIRDIVVYPVRTSATGEYVFEDLPTGEYQLAVAGYRTPPVRVAADTIFDIDVPAALNVSGTVVDAAREPVSSAKVTMFFLERDVDRPPAAVTNQLGTFNLGMVQPGDYLVTIHKSGYEMVRERITVGASNVDLTRTLREDEGVAVRLRSGDGKSIPGATLVEMSEGQLLSRIWLRSDERGEGRIPSAFAGTHFKIFADGYEPIEVMRWDGGALDLSFTPAAAAR